MAQQKNGITQKSTRPTRRARREQQSGLASMIEHESEPATTQPAAAPTATTAARLDAAAARKRPQKIPTSTYLGVDTTKRLNWLIEKRQYVKSDVFGIALDALFDQMDVPAGSELDDSYINNKR